MSNESRESQIQPEENKGKSSNQGNQSDCNITQSKVAAEPTPPAQFPESVDNSRKTAREKTSWCEMGTFWLEVAGVLGLAFYCWVNWREWQTFDSERSTMEREFQTNQVATLAAQQIAANQIVEMQKDRDIDERSWVAPFEMTSVIDPMHTNSAVFVLRFKNTGKTPALNMSETHKIAWNVRNVSTNADPIPKTSLLLAPGVIYWINSDSIDSQTVNAIKNGMVPPFYMYGKITYDDIFGNHHWTEFCWSFEGGGNCRPASVHNSCDEAQTDQTN